MSRVMLLTIEVAMEFWLSLQWTPQAQWLRDAETPCNALKLEVHAHSSALAFRALTARILCTLNAAYMMDKGRATLVYKLCSGARCMTFMLKG